MGYIQGEGRVQGTLFPVVLDDFVPADHVCRVIDAFVEPRETHFCCLTSEPWLSGRVDVPTFSARATTSCRKTGYCPKCRLVVQVESPTEVSEPYGDSRYLAPVFKVAAKRQAS